MCSTAPCQPQLTLAGSIIEKGGCFFIINYSRHNQHLCCTVPVVEVPKSSEKLTTLFLRPPCLIQCLFGKFRQHSCHQDVNENLNTDWLSWHSVTRCRLKSSIFSTLSDEAMKAMKAMDATSCDSHCVYCEIWSPQSDVASNHVFTSTLYNGFIAFCLNAA